MWSAEFGTGKDFARTDGKSFGQRSALFSWYNMLWDVRLANEIESDVEHMFPI